MKSKPIFFSVLLSSVFLFNCEKEEVVSETDLPTPAKEFIALHFTNQTIANVVKEKDILEKKPTYEVTLGNGTSLDFDQEGSVTEIDGKQTKLPDSIIPAKIAQYVHTTYANDYIVGWEKEGENQDIELNTQLELRFDKNNDFVSIQD
jgi:hypothetical protein